MTSSKASSGSLFVIAAPSGAGKSSLVNALLQREPTVKLSISCTTRAPRPGEQHGREYFFLSESDFLKRQREGEFLESASVHGNYYGTSRTMVSEHTSAGHDVVLEIDWQGAQQIRKHYPESVGIFILPPSLASLEERLRKRAQDSEEVIARRVRAASSEIEHAPEFEYVIINTELEVAWNQLTAAVQALRWRYSQQAERSRSLYANSGIHVKQN